MNEKKKVFIICGSASSSASNRKLIEYIALKYSNNLILDIYESVHQLPHFIPGDISQKHAQVIEDFLNRIDTSDAVLISTPEYVFSLPGSLKNALEWTVSSTVFTEKPVGLIVASAAGEKAYESLQLIMKTIQARVKEECSLLIRGIAGKIDDQGHLKDVATQQRLHDLMRNLLDSLYI